MHLGGVSAWDTLAVLYPDEPALTNPLTTPADAAELRCRRRIAAFEEAFVLARDARPLEPHAWKIGLIANDLERRWVRWGGHEGGPLLKAPASSQSTRQRRAVVVWSATIAGVIVLALAVFAFLSAVPASRLWTRGLIAIGVLGALVVLVMLQRRFIRLRGSVSQRACPTCAYALDGLPSAIEPRLLKGLDPGPRVCPECGTLWPLVPPGDFPRAGVE